MLQRLLAVFFLLLLSPVLVLIYFLLKMDGGSTIFKEKRAGKDLGPFVMYKFRTMRVGAEKVQKKYAHLNEADGPVFKIRNDPRFTSFGRWLSHSGLDELPQLLNVARGEMSLVGPRPLPVQEAEGVPEKYRRRFSVRPGITSPWIVKGSHAMSFRKWMELDIEYVDSRSVVGDLLILLKTMGVVVSSMFSR